LCLIVVVMVTVKVQTIVTVMQIGTVKMIVV
jgi:hypothetical protein